MSITVHTGPYKRQAARLMDLKRWSGVEAFWKAQAKGVMKEVIAYIPPGQGKADLGAKKRGEGAVEGDLQKLFEGVSPQRAEQTDLAPIHDRHRNARGKVIGVRKNAQYKVPRAALTAYIRETKTHVGYLAAGFNAAAAKVGYRPPAWIWRHHSPGSVSLRITDRGIRFLATNAVPYASKIAILERQIQKGITAQTSKIRREVDFLLKRQAKAAGFKVR
jgi:hypothetical protein